MRIECQSLADSNLRVISYKQLEALQSFFQYARVQNPKYMYVVLAVQKIETKDAGTSQSRPQVNGFYVNAISTEDMCVLI